MVTFMCKIITHIIPEIVKVRKYKVDTQALCECLRTHKKLLNMSNIEISKALDVNITTVEHWFRTDNCFAIPNVDVWFKLKELLQIETNIFDKSIMTFETKLGKYEKSYRVYDTDGIAPTLTSTNADIKIIVR